MTFTLHRARVLARVRACCAMAAVAPPPASSARPFARARHPARRAGARRRPRAAGSASAEAGAAAGADAGAADASDADDALIEVKDVHKWFGDKHVLRGVSFSIRRGEAVGVIGSSGTGKSTALRVIAGLLMPDRGEVLIDGKARSGLLSDEPVGSSRLHVGMVFQSAALFDSLTVGRNVGFVLYEHSSLPDEEIERRVAKVLVQVGLAPDVADLYPAEISGGMKKRVALARAIISDVPEGEGEGEGRQGKGRAGQQRGQQQKQEQVILYDEPSAGLDTVSSTVVENLIRDLVTHKDSQVSSYVVVTHQHSTIRRACDRLIFLHEGCVVWEGDVAEFDTTDEPIVVQFRTGSLDGPIQYK